MAFQFGSFKLTPFWEKSRERLINEMDFSGVGLIGIPPVSKIPTIAKYAAVGGAGALAAAFALNKGLNQASTQEQAAKATSGGYTIYAYPDSQVSVTEPKTGSASIDQAATTSQTSIDTSGIMSILMIAAVIAVIMMLRK